jgi:hypothetical protein
VVSEVSRLELVFDLMELDVARMATERRFREVIWGSRPAAGGDTVPDTEAAASDAAASEGRSAS